MLEESNIDPARRK